MLSNICPYFISDEVLANSTATYDNPFGTNVYFQGYRFVGFYEYSSNSNGKSTPESSTSIESSTESSNEIETMD